MDFIWILLAIITGGMIGIGITLAVHQDMRRKLKALQDVEKEYESYKEEVTEHFVGTAGLVNQLTQSYKAVYDHLEGGAVKLVGEEKLTKALGHVKHEPVVLESLGAARGAIPQAASRATRSPEITSRLQADTTATLTADHLAPRTSSADSPTTNIEVEKVET